MNENYSDKTLGSDSNIDDDILTDGYDCSTVDYQQNLMESVCKPFEQYVSLLQTKLR